MRLAAAVVFATVIVLGGNPTRHTARCHALTSFAYVCDAQASRETSATALVRSADGCKVHGDNPSVRVTMCVEHVDPTHCRLAFHIFYKHAGIHDTIGGKVPCITAGRAGDPGDRRPK